MVKANIQNAPVIVVLHCGYGRRLRSGLSRFALDRVMRGVSLWKRDVAPYLLFSGGGADRWDNLSGAERMAQEAIRLKVPEDRIIVETESKDTRQNVRYTVHILEKKGWRRLVLVTDDYHLKRARLLFTQKGFLVYPAPVTCKTKIGWKGNWTYLQRLCYEMLARMAYRCLSDRHIDRIIDLIRPE